MVHLTRCSTNSPESTVLIQRYAQEEDFRHAQRYNGPSRTQQSLLGRALTRGLLGLANDVNPTHWVFPSSLEGPLTATTSSNDAMLYYSISHSGDHVMAAVSNLGPIGIDIERYSANRDMKKLITSIYSGPDHLLPKTEKGLYRLWTLFEAYCKARHQKLVFPIPEELLTVAFNTKDPKAVYVAVNNLNFAFVSQALPAYNFSFCQHISS